MTKLTEEQLLWFLQPPERIQQMIDELPPQATPEADRLLQALELARSKQCENVFLQSVLDYMKAGAVFETAVAAAIEDWEL